MSCHFTSLSLSLSLFQRLFPWLAVIWKRIFLFYSLLESGIKYVRLVHLMEFGRTDQRLNEAARLIVFILSLSPFDSLACIGWGLHEKTLGKEREREKCVSKKRSRSRFQEMKTIIRRSLYDVSFLSKWSEHEESSLNKSAVGSTRLIHKKWLIRAISCDRALHYCYYYSGHCAKDSHRERMRGERENDILCVCPFLPGARIQILADE